MKIVGLLLGALLLGVGVFYFTSVPTSEIDKLPTHFVQIHVKPDLLADYKIVNKPTKDWLPLKKISKHITQAIIVSEDWTFYHHEGYDAEQIREAINKGMEKGKPMRGASTITQQLAKNLFLDASRSYIRKLRELLITLKLEGTLSKNQILEIYLNIIEYGPGVYGINKASHYYFGKNPSQITAREAAFIAMLLPNPKKYSQSFRSKKLTPFAQAMIRNILGKLVMAGHITEDERQEQLKTPFSWETVPSGLEKGGDEAVPLPDMETEVKVTREAGPGESKDNNEERAEEKKAEDESLPTPQAQEVEMPASVDRP